MGNYYGQPPYGEGDGKAARFFCPLIMTALALMGVAAGLGTLAIIILKIVA